MKIDDIKNYIGHKQTFNNIANEIYEITKHLNNIYPNYKEWFYNKQLKETENQNRTILFIRNNENKIIAISSLKKSTNEKKICTLYIKEEYRKQGLGTIILEESMKYLQTTKPLITIPKSSLALFKNIIKKYNWNLTQIKHDEYQYN